VPMGTIIQEGSIMAFVVVTGKRILGQGDFCLRERTVNPTRPGDGPVWGDFFGQEGGRAITSYAAMRFTHPHTAASYNTQGQGQSKDKANG
jgi:hypothetical protein